MLDDEVGASGNTITEDGTFVSGVTTHNVTTLLLEEIVSGGAAVIFGPAEPIVDQLRIGAKHGGY